ncbi:MAG: LPP20 family lipoprotein [Pseudomonadota bacterium]
MRRIPIRPRHPVTGPALLLVLAGLLVACAGGPEHEPAPDWVHGDPAADYPENAWLTGSGRAARLAEARNLARAELARRFRVTVVAETRDEEREVDGELSRTIDHGVRTRTDEVLTGVRIAEVWREPDNGAYHALAVLSRERAATDLRESIRELDRATETHLEQAATADDGLAVVAALTRALEAQRTRHELQPRLRILDPDGRGIPPRHDRAELAEERRASLATLRVTAEVAGDDDGSLQRALSGALANLGLDVVAAGTADYRMVVEPELTDRGRRDGWYWVEGEVVLRIVETDGDTRSESRHALRASATDAATARQRALNRTAELFREVLPGLLWGEDD